MTCCTLAPCMGRHCASQRVLATEKATWPRSLKGLPDRAQLPRAVFMIFVIGGPVSSSRAHTFMSVTDFTIRNTEVKLVKE